MAKTVCIKLQLCSKVSSHFSKQTSDNYAIVSLTITHNTFQNDVKDTGVKAKDLLIRDKAGVKDIQCKPKSQCTCSANLCTLSKNVTNRHKNF